MYLVLMVLLSQIHRNRDSTLGIIEEMLNVSLSEEPPTPSMAAALNTLGVALRFDDVIDDSTFDLFERALSRFFDRSRCRGKGDRRIFIWSEESYYLYSLFVKNSKIDSPMIQRFLHTIVQEKDWSLLKQFLDRIVGCAIETGIVFPFVRILYPLLVAERPIGELTIERMARLRLYYPEAVDDALAELDIPELIQHQIRDRTPSESFSGLLVCGLTIFLRDILILDESHFILDEARNLLYSATESTEMKQWLRLLVARIANIVYGEPLF